MDVRKVQSIVNEIYAGGKIKVAITEDLDSLGNDARVLAIGSVKTIQYMYHTASELMAKYFEIIEEHNDQIISLIDKYKISISQYFPIFGFSKICPDLKTIDLLKQNQSKKITVLLESIKNQNKKHSSIDDVYKDASISNTNKSKNISWNTIEGNIKLDDLEDFLKKCENKNCTSYRQLLCVYDFKKYNESQ